ncbi:MAG: hypothetical protein P1R58_11590 [bacterium]|nr:hypothetical protein [bacterium]
MNSARFAKLTAAVGSILIMALVVSCIADRTGDDLSRHKKLAGELRDAKLYHAAVDEYVMALELPGLESTTRANINYLIAKLYFENIKDYEQAASYYVRARTLDPNGSFISEASRNLVTSMERMGRMLDAGRELNAATNIEAEPASDSDVEVARVGGNPIWLSEIDQQIQSLEPEAQKQFKDPAAKIQFVHQYVGVELLYHAALREQYDQDDDVKNQLRLLQKRLLVDKYVLKKVMPTVRIDTSDVMNFYKANAQTRYNNAPYDSVRATVFMDYQMVKTESAYSDYIANLAKAEKVEFLDHNVK